jgi:hypothetical protein
MDLGRAGGAFALVLGCAPIPPTVARIRSRLTMALPAILHGGQVSGYA